MEENNLRNGVSGGVRLSTLVTPVILHIKSVN